MYQLYLLHASGCSLSTIDLSNIPSTCNDKSM
uniref:Uncharacterized protein n=1 Tax=viral metagenome TaxID=1070528 RepID=A0A6C0BKD7_9ZZZZ